MNRFIEKHGLSALLFTGAILLAVLGDGDWAWFVLLGLICAADEDKQ